MDKGAVEFSFAAFRDRYVETIRLRDVAGHLALYAEDAHVFDLWGDWSLDGKPALRAMVENWFGSLGDETVQLDLSDVMTFASLDMAVCHTFIRFAAIAPDGQELRAMDNRFTWAFVRQGADWVIRHQHSSVPLGEGAAPQFNRQG